MIDSIKEKKSKAGHYEIHGETIAKFEFFDNGFNPYSRYLDIDKIDLILRKQDDKQIKYIEVQVKYGTLFQCGQKWEQNLFDFTSWRFFKENEFDNLANPNLYIAYVLVNPKGYNGDIFIFKSSDFNDLIKKAIVSNTQKGKKYKMFIAHSKTDNNWYILKKTGFTELTSETVINVTNYRRNFNME